MEVRFSRAVANAEILAVGVFRDITQRRAYTRALEFQALHDPLTGLANRDLLRDRLSQAIRNSHRHRKTFALMLLDLDRFKEVNDRLGHAAGDAVLTEFGRRLRAAVRESDTTARLGGDEFAVIIEDAASPDAAADTAAQVMGSIAGDYWLDSVVVTLSVSVGIALHAGGSADATVMGRADDAMYRAKRTGSGIVVDIQAG